MCESYNAAEMNASLDTYTVLLVCCLIHGKQSYIKRNHIYLHIYKTNSYLNKLMVFLLHT